jgi:hypothetical protein
LDSLGGYLRSLLGPDDAPTPARPEFCSFQPVAPVRRCEELDWLEASGEQWLVSRPPQDGRPDTEEPKVRSEPPGAKHECNAWL